MEKKEIIKKLYELKTNLLLLAHQFELIEKKEKFETLYIQNQNLFSYNNIDILQLKAMLLPLAIEPIIDKKTVWFPVWENIKSMYQIEDNRVVDLWINEAYQKKQKVNNLVFLFDWMTDDKTLLEKEDWLFYQDYGSPYRFSLDMFRHNIYSLEVQKKIVLDAIENKHSPLYDFYKKDFIRNEMLNKIEAEKKKFALVREDIKKDLKQEFGISEIRNSDEKKKDQAIISDLNEALFILRDKYDFIDYRDWGFIDSLIFFFESGRADTIKEALNLADNKKFHEDVLGALSEINHTMVRGINLIRRDLNVYFTNLYSQLETLNSSLVNVANEIAANTEAVNRTSESIYRAVQGIRQRM